MGDYSKPFCIDDRYLEEVRTIIKDAHQQAINILTENIDKLHELSKYLLEKETITGEEFMKMLNDKEIRTFAN